MTDLIFLKALRDKLKGGNTKSIHLNILPGRFATRLDLANLNHIDTGFADSFLKTLMSKSTFEFKISFDKVDLTKASQEEQKRFGLLSKRLNSLNIENEDNFKEHGIKTFGFGYPILVKPSKQDPTKIIKAPLFIWQLEMVRASNKVNTWSILRNKTKTETGKIVDDEIHSVGLNEVLLSFLKNDEGLVLPQLNEDLLEDAVIDENEMVAECFNVLKALNASSYETSKQALMQKLRTPINNIPEAATIDAQANNSAWIHFGGVFGLFRTQKESIITDLDRLIENADRFEFDDLVVEKFSGSTHSAVETDPSQQEILNTLGLEPKKIIQGPPGTGKSQSLTALITNALANNLKCLVVCEKKTAHEVIKANLHNEDQHLGELAAVIEDISKDRDAIVNSVRERVSNPTYAYSYNQISYDTLKQNIDYSLNEINKSHRKLDEDLYQGKKWTALVGEFLKVEGDSQHHELTRRIDYKDFKFRDDQGELSRFLGKIKMAKQLYTDVKTSSHPLEVLHPKIFTDENFRVVKARLEEFLERNSNDLKSLDEQLTNDVSNYHDWLDEHYIGLESITRDTMYALQKDLATYRQWLDTHYRGHHFELSNQIRDFKNYVAKNEISFGEIFLKDDSFTKFKINILKPISSKFKSLASERSKFLNELERVKQINIKYDYIQHRFTQLSGNLYNSVIEDLESLEKKAEKWIGEVDTLVAKNSDKFGGNRVHQDFNGKDAVIDLERTFSELSSRIAKDKYLKFPFKDLGSHKQKVYALEHFLDSFSSVDEVKKNHKNGFSSSQKHPEFDATAIAQSENKFSKWDNGVRAADMVGVPKDQKQDHHKKINHLHKVNSIFVSITENLNEFGTFYNWKQFILGLSNLEREVIESLIEINSADWEKTFTAWYYYWLLATSEHKDLPNDDERIVELIQHKKDLKGLQIKNLVNYWTGRQRTSIARLQQTLQLSPVSLYNKKGAPGQRRNSLRKIVSTDFNLFTDFYPVVMVSPSVCSSIIPLTEGLFDIVIFDEASQLRIEDTYPALLRGKIKIVSGDSQQMPPANFFQGGNALLNPTEDDYDEEIAEITPDEAAQNIRKVNQSYELAESESLLVYAENCSYSQSYLKVHYRSQHPYLIDFSNHAFYGKRLIPMPAKVDYKPIEFIDVKGLYEDSCNRDEAKKVVDLLLNKIERNPDGKYPSVGVATFNLYQRNLILDEINLARQNSPKADKKFADLGSELFVKNLENIQGDERDIIILSTTFGRKKDGNFRQHFGPLVQGKGYKLLNVIVTRAKLKVYVCSSFPAEHINQYSTLLQQYRNTGRAVLYAYLAYAKAVSEGNDETRTVILDQLYENCDSKSFEVEDNSFSESPFEEEVFYRLAQRIGAERIQQQYPIGGFRIDMVIKSKLTGKPMIALECDGAKYHSSNEAYAWDMFRQSQLENQGFIFYRIWSTNWWNGCERELEKLIQFIYLQDVRESNFGSAEDIKYPE